jgi:hypothetical protein
VEVTLSLAYFDSEKEKMREACLNPTYATRMDKFG